MKRYLIILVAALVLVLSACSGAGEVLETLPTDSPAIAEATPEQTPTPTTPPDYAGIDFSGSWYVDQLIDSNGDTVSQGEMQGLGSDFTLELLPEGTYFVYNAKDAVLGQGIYTVAQNLLTLTAGESQTVYEIQDENTLQSKQADNSVTVMKRVMADPAEDDPDSDTPEETTGEDTANGETAGDDTFDDGELIA